MFVAESDTQIVDVCVQDLGDVFPAAHSVQDFDFFLPRVYSLVGLYCCAGVINRSIGPKLSTTSLGDGQSDMYEDR